MPRGAVVLLQLEFLHLRVIVLEIEDVLDIGAAKTVDALRIIAHHADVLMAGGQFLYNQVLGVVGVLILIHHDMAETFLIFEQRFGKIPEKHVGVEQQVVEIHNRGLAHTAVVFQKDTACLRHTHALVFFQKRVGLVVVSGGNQAVLRHRDTVKHAGILVGFGVKVEILHDFLDERLAVVCIVDAERFLIADQFGFGMQDFGKDGVEGSHPERAGLWAYQCGDTCLHFAGGLVGEGKRQDAERVATLFNQVGDTVGKRACLARTGAGYDHHRSVDMLRCRPLFRVKAV